MAKEIKFNIKAREDAMESSQRKKQSNNRF